MLRILTFIFAAIIFMSCKDSSSNKNNPPNLDKAKQDKDSIILLNFKQDIKDSLISNTTNRRIDILFNGINNFLGGQRNPKLNFETECTVCNVFQSYDKGLIFGKRLFIDKSIAKIYSKGVKLSDTTDIVKGIGFYGDRKRKIFKFSRGNVTMQFQGTSCNDADYVKVSLAYERGRIEINKLINATFFEYDLDKDGEMEQYLFGVRNCSQEIIVLRIVKP